MTNCKTSSPAHTSGEWFAHFDREQQQWRVLATRRRRSGALTVDFLHELAALPGRSAETAANARLMAAAPKLLERCQMALIDAEAAVAEPHRVADWNWKSIADDLRGAIAEVQGERT